MNTSDILLTVNVGDHELDLDLKVSFNIIGKNILSRSSYCKKTSNFIGADPEEFMEFDIEDLHSNSTHKLLDRYPTIYDTVINDHYNEIENMVIEDLDNDY